MGYARSLDMAVATANGTINLHTALLDHFTVNMWPPVPTVMIPTAQHAIKLAAEDRLDEVLPVPDCVVMHKDGETIEDLTVRQAVDDMRLQAFVDVQRRINARS